MRTSACISLFASAFVVLDGAGAQLEAEGKEKEDGQPSFSRPLEGGRKARVVRLPSESTIQSWPLLVS